MKKHFITLDQTKMVLEFLRDNSQLIIGLPAILDSKVIASFGEFISQSDELLQFAEYTIHYKLYRNIKEPFPQNILYAKTGIKVTTSPVRTVAFEYVQLDKRTKGEWVAYKYNSIAQPTRIKASEIRMQKSSIRIPKGGKIFIGQDVDFEPLEKTFAAFNKTFEEMYEYVKMTHINASEELRDTEDEWENVDSSTLHDWKNAPTKSGDKLTGVFDRNKLASPVFKYDRWKSDTLFTHAGKELLRLSLEYIKIADESYKPPKDWKQSISRVTPTVKEISKYASLMDKVAPLYKRIQGNFPISGEKAKEKNFRNYQWNGKYYTKPDISKEENQTINYTTAWGVIHQYLYIHQITEIELKNYRNLIMNVARIAISELNTTIITFNNEAIKNNRTMKEEARIRRNMRKRRGAMKRFIANK